jgi:hypothetical protein
MTFEKIIMRKILVLIAIFAIFLPNSSYGEENIVFFNLQWRNLDTKINEAHIGDRILINFETENIFDNMIIDIEIWRKKDGELIDFIKKLQGTVKNHSVELDWVVEFDENNENTNYFREIKETGYAIIDYVFVIKFNNENIYSNILEILARFERRITDAKTGEPLGNREFALYSPDGQFIFGTTDNEGYARVNNIRKIGYYNLIT